jgi:hypothetical protein
MYGLSRGACRAVSSWFSLTPSSFSAPSFPSPSVVSFGPSFFSSSSQHPQLAGGAISPSQFSSSSSAFFSSSASSCAAPSSNDPTAEEILEAKPHLLKPKQRSTQLFSSFSFWFNEDSTDALKALKKAKFTAVPDGDGFGFLETEQSFFHDVESSNILFVRKFYP